MLPAARAGCSTARRGAGTGTSTPRRNRRRAAFTKPRRVERTPPDIGVLPIALRPPVPHRWPTDGHAADDIHMQRVLAADESHQPRQRAALGGAGEDEVQATKTLGRQPPG